MRLQGLGLNTVLFCTTPFLAMAAAILKSLGNPGVRVVEVQHPLGDLAADEVVTRAEAVYGSVDQIVDVGNAEGT